MINKEFVKLTKKDIDLTNDYSTYGGSEIKKFHDIELTNKGFTFVVNFKDFVKLILSEMNAPGLYSFRVNTFKTIEEFLNNKEKIKIHKKEDIRLIEYIFSIYESYVNEDYVDKRNKEEEKKIKEKTKEIDKKYNLLMQAYKNLRYKKDIENLKELDDLLYCEAEPILDKILSRIEKKSNPKNIKLYKEIARLEKKQIIECKY